MSSINAIRKQIRVEPQDYGDNHPKVGYLMLSHGMEEQDNEKSYSNAKKRIVPKGCIIVVKTHSGDTSKYVSFSKNVVAVLEKKNRDIMLDPVNHKVEIYNTFEESILNRNAMGIIDNHTVAIYREGDYYPDFVYSPVITFPDNTLVQSGILRFESDTPENTELIEDLQKREEGKFDAETPAFILENDKYVYNTKLFDISSYFKYSNLNKYYFGEKQVNDIIDCIAEFVGGNDSIVSKTKKFENADFNSNLMSDIHTRALIKLSSNPEKLKEYNELSNPKERYEYRTGVMKTFTVRDVLEIISLSLLIPQSGLFDLVKMGQLQPGIFYHLACRATGETDMQITKMLRKDKQMLSSWKPYSESNSPQNRGRTIRAIQRGIKNRISEAELQRKNQIRQVMNSRKNAMKNVFTRNIKNVYSRKIQNSIISKYKNIEFEVPEGEPSPEYEYKDKIDDILQTTNTAKKNKLFNELHSLEEKYPNLRLKILAKLLITKQQTEDMIKYDKPNNKNSPFRKTLIRIEAILKGFYSDIPYESKPIPF
jgi:hypothetical protein